MMRPTCALGLMLLAASCATQGAPLPSQPSPTQAAPAPVKETAKEVAVDDDWLTTTESDLNKMDADDVAVCTVVEEGSKFFYFLNQTGALEATPKKSLAEFNVGLNPRAFKVKYPVRVKIDAKLRDPAGRQQYLLTKDAENAPWRMTEGWAVAPKGQKGAALPLPSEESQAAANKHVSEHVKKHR